MNLPFPQIMTPSVAELHEGQVSQNNLAAPGIFWLLICKLEKCSGTQVLSIWMSEMGGGKQVVVRIF